MEPWAGFQATVHGSSLGARSPSGSWLFYQPEAPSVLIHPFQMPGARDCPGPLGEIFEDVALLRILVVWFGNGPRIANGPMVHLSKPPIGHQSTLQELEIPMAEVSRPPCSLSVPPPHHHPFWVGSICRGHDWPVSSPKEDSRQGKREQGKERQTDKELSSSWSGRLDSHL